MLRLPLPADVRSAAAVVASQGQYGVAYTKGLQWGNDTRYTKAIGALKHYTIYSVENSGGHGASRGSSYFEIAMRDIEETYLPQFKAPVVEAKSLGT